MSSKCNILAELDKYSLRKGREGKGRKQYRRLQASRLVPNEEKWNLPCCNLQLAAPKCQTAAAGGEWGVGACRGAKQSQQQEQLPVHKQ